LLWGASQSPYQQLRRAALHSLPASNETGLRMCPHPGPARSRGRSSGRTQPANPFGFMVCQRHRWAQASSKVYAVFHPKSRLAADGSA